MVAETSLKWRVVEPAPGQFFFELADEELAWARGLGFPVKGHTLLWGNAPPFSTGSGTPDWLLARFPNRDLSPAEREDLRALLRLRVEATVGRYRGRIDIWDVSNETLNVFTPWFIDRLGPDIVNDMRATLGEYVASWEENGTTMHVRFSLGRGPGTAVIAAITPRS